MRFLKNVGAAVCALVTLAVFVTTAQAQEPHYLQSLSELRAARDYLQADHRGGGFGEERKQAIEEINQAIDEIKHAAWDDGKNTKYAPPVQGWSDPWGPLHEALRWVDSAGNHVREGVDQPENQGLRDRASRHIANARQIIVTMLQQAGGH